MLVFQRVYILPLLAIETWFVWGIDMCYPAKNYPCSFLFPPLPNFRLFVISIRCSIYSHDISFVDAITMGDVLAFRDNFPNIPSTLVGGLEHFSFFPYIGNTWEHSFDSYFFRGVGQPPTRLHFPYIPIRSHEIISQSYWTWPIEIVDLPNWKMVIFQFANCKRLPVML